MSVTQVNHWWAVDIARSLVSRQLMRVNRVATWCSGFRVDIVCRVARKASSMLVISRYCNPCP